MSPRFYAYGIRADSEPVPLLVWQFDSRWLRDAVTQENPAFLRVAPARDVRRRALRSQSNGYALQLASGIRVYLYDGPRPPEPFPALPPLRLPAAFAPSVRRAVA